MKSAGIATFALLLAAAPVHAAEPLGEWLVKDGTARIKVEPCGHQAGGHQPGAKPGHSPAPRGGQGQAARPAPQQPASKLTLCGFISWTKDAPGTDQYNPDPAKRSRSVLGMQILHDMHPSPQQPNRWEGEVYNAQNGKTYKASIMLVEPDVLRIQGCVLGFLCGGEDWTRAKTEAPAQRPAPGRGPRGGAI